MIVTKLKAYGAALGAALTALGAALAPNTTASLIVGAVLTLLTAFGVYQAPYHVPAKPGVEPGI